MTSAHGTTFGSSHGSWPTTARRSPFFTASVRASSVAKSSVTTTGSSSTRSRYVFGTSPISCESHFFPSTQPSW